MRRNYIVERLNMYFAGNYTLNRVPLLIGPSGVAKSALIKEAAEKNDMRVVDIRTAFISRLDIEGLTEKIEIDGKYFSSASPMLSLLKCTDEYLRVARECVKIIEEELTKVSAEEKVVLEKTLARLKEESKTPVLLFDEITRGEASVRQVLTKIFTDKAFMGYSMKEARVVAATNAQVNRSGEDMGIYSTNDAYDVAFYDRFESMYVDNKVMDQYWTSWAQKNFRPDVMKMVDVPYDNTHFDNTDIRTALTTPYKCYRTWEMVNDYYTRCSSPVTSFVNSIIGGGLRKLGMTDFIKEAITYNIPALVISSSGMGKTSRVNQICKSKGYEMIDINLSEIDRLDLEGMPVKRSVASTMFEGAQVNKGIFEKVKEIFRTAKLPNYCTIRAPKKEFVDKFNKALETGNKVVIYFDECNRVQNVSVMSAIFQVISDHRLFGVDFDPKNVTCILSCNLDDNCGDAQDLDPALCARFAIWEKQGYTNEDAREYIDYAEKAGFNSVVLGYLRSLDDNKLRELLSSVNSRTMTVSAASSRAIEDLSRTLNDIQDPAIVGNMLYNSSDICERMSSFIKYSYGNVSDIIDRIKNRVASWALSSFLDEEFSINSEFGTVSGDTVYKYVCKCAKEKTTDELINDRKFLCYIQAVDTDIWQYRVNFFTGILGSYASEFVEYLNSIEDYLTGARLVSDYSIARETIVNSLDRVDDLISLMNEVPVVFKDIDTSSRLARSVWNAIKGKYDSTQQAEIWAGFSDDVRRLYNVGDYIKNMRITVSGSLPTVERV